MVMREKLQIRQQELARREDALLGRLEEIEQERQGMREAVCTEVGEKLKLYKDYRAKKIALEEKEFQMVKSMQDEQLRIKQEAQQLA